MRHCFLNHPPDQGLSEHLPCPAGSFVAANGRLRTADLLQRSKMVAIFSLESLFVGHRLQRLPFLYFLQNLRFSLLTTPSFFHARPARQPCLPLALIAWVSA